MRVDIKMPKLGESITEGTIVKWWKKPGDHVQKDETLLEISTDKVDSEIPSPYEGEIVEILKNENDTVEVDSVIARIETDSKEAAKTAKDAEPPKKEQKEEIKVEQPKKEQPKTAPKRPSFCHHPAIKIFYPLYRYQQILKQLYPRTFLFL